MPSGVDEYYINASSVGERAWEAFVTSLSGSVIGVTSGGIFMRAGADQIVFISRLAYRSPLTITLDPDKSALQLLEVGMAVEFTPERLFFPQPSLTILVDSGVRWAAPLPAVDLVDRSGGISERLRSLACGVWQQKGDLGLSVLLPGLLQLPNSEKTEHSLVEERVMAVHSRLRGGSFSSLENALLSLLGLGRGLTPSGDDLLVGFLLALNRWPEALQPHFDVGGLNRQIAAMAYQATTHLSANLIACAAAGAADERLLDGLDYVVTGQGNADLITVQLAEMGSSSGADSLVGIMFAFEACGRAPSLS